MSEKVGHSSNVGSVSWEIKDPNGFSHVVMRDATREYHGTNNLAHCIEDVMRRPYVMSMLIYKFSQQPEMGEWEGYSWLKL